VISILDNLKMVSSMGMEVKNMPMETITKDSLLTDFLKVMENTFGMTEINIKGTLSRDIEMGMEFGKMIIKTKHIEAITCWIKSMVMEFILGETAIATKETILKTIDTAKENYTTKKK
jgi:hypothetical protein